MSKKPSPSVSCRLWTINRWIRWTGWRFFIGFPDAMSADQNGRIAFLGPMTVGLVWYGWGFVGHESAAGRWPKRLRHYSGEAKVYLDGVELPDATTTTTKRGDDDV